MGHIRLGTLSQSKKWRDVIGLLDSGAPLINVTEAAARASELDLGRASDDPSFQFVTGLLVRLPLMARAPDFSEALLELGAGTDSLQSVSAFLSGLSQAIDRSAFETGGASDVGELARAALLESLSVQFRDNQLSLFSDEQESVRSSLARLASGQNFALLARDFFSRLTYRSLDYFLSRELANHTGLGKRFSKDVDRVAFEHALSQHVFEASRIVEAFAGGWFGKTVWKEQSLNQDSINKFTHYAFKKMRSELGRRRETA